MSSPQHEPTMEEILASIRKIISEDNPEAQAAAPAEVPQPAPAAAQPAPKIEPEPVKAAQAAPEPEVLELTQEVLESPEPPKPEPAREIPPQPAPQPAAAPKAEEIVFELAPQREPANDGIFSDQTRKAMEETFAAIPGEAEEPVPPAPTARPSLDGASVESVFERAVKESFVPVLENYLAENSGIVVERMKPLIREWMDENFPELLEKAVKGEVERIVKARSRH